jgi:putative oxidoreductase
VRGSAADRPGEKRRVASIRDLGAAGIAAATDAVPVRGSCENRRAHSAPDGEVPMRFLVRWFIDWPARVARPLHAIAPLFARIVVGWVFLWSGWGKLQNLPLVTENFVNWNIPAPQILTPFVSGVEFVGGILLLVGLLTRISAGALGIVMIVATIAAKAAFVDSLATLLGFEEMAYLAIFLWLAIAGAGAISLDHLIQRRYDHVHPET